MSITRILGLVVYAIALIGTLVSFYLIFGPGDPSGKAAQDLSDPNIVQGTGIGLGVSYVLLVIAVLLTLVFAPINGIAQNPGSIKGIAIGIGSLLVIFLIGYAIADDTVTPMYERMYITTPKMSKLVGGVLNASYILTIIAALAYLYSSINSIIKNS